MSGRLNHPPAEIVQQLIVDYGLGILGGEEGAWPVYSGMMPDGETDPSEVIAVFGTDGKLEGREHVEQEMEEKYGVQVRTRSKDTGNGYVKCKAISDMFDTKVYRREVVMGTDVYLIQSILRTSMVIDMGADPVSRRRNWSVNAIVTMKMTTG